MSENNKGNAEEIKTNHGKPNATVISTGEWLAVSTEGFAEQQRGRPLIHLLKELVQNSLDGVGDAGQISLHLSIDKANPSILRVGCVDDGEGSDDLSKLNIVFVTGKKDSVTKRGRMGRGFKELLSVARAAKVKSGTEELFFGTDKEGVRTVTLKKAVEPRTNGFSVLMLVEHDDAKSEDDIKALTDYFDTFIIPTGIKFIVNGKVSQGAQLVHRIAARLTTEQFNNSRWNKPLLHTEVHLYKCREDQSPLIYEMGIPVCQINWDMPYHADVRQRVPMNPNRDSVMTNYDARLRRACLPTLLEELDEDQVKSSWIGEAASESTDAVQEIVVKKAFGENAVRFVQTSGNKYDHNASATEKVGSVIVDTRHMTGGFSALAKKHLPTAKAVVEIYNRELSVLAQNSAVEAESLDDATLEAGKYIDCYGKERVKRMLEFARAFCEQLIARRHGNEKTPVVRVAAAVLPHDEATWGENGKLSLSLCLEYWWTAPVSDKHYATLIHEAAHHEAAHHGISFANTVELYAGVAAALMSESGELRKMAREVHRGEGPGLYEKIPASSAQADF